jgi:hypothetical protein
MREVTRAAILAAMMVWMTGCESRDERLANVAQNSMAEQARQNVSMAQQSHEIARQSGQLTKVAQDLVQQDAAARREIFGEHSRLQSQLHDERMSLEKRRREIDLDQQLLNAAMRRGPVVAEAIVTAGLVLAALLPLVVTVFALCRLPTCIAGSDQDLADAMLDELSGRSVLGDSDSHRALDQSSAPPRLGDRPDSVTP